MPRSFIVRLPAASLRSPATAQLLRGLHAFEERVAPPPIDVIPASTALSAAYRDYEDSRRFLLHDWWASLVVNDGDQPAAVVQGTSNALRFVASIAAEGEEDRLQSPTCATLARRFEVIREADAVAHGFDAVLQALHGESVAALAAAQSVLLARLAALEQGFEKRADPVLSAALLPPMTRFLFDEAGYPGSLYPRLRGEAANNGGERWASVSQRQEHYAVEFLGAKADRFVPTMTPAGGDTHNDATDMTASSLLQYRESADEPLFRAVNRLVQRRSAGSPFHKPLPGGMLPSADALRGKVRVGGSLGPMSGAATAGAPPRS